MATCAAEHNAGCQTAAGFVSVTLILENVLPMREAGARQGECSFTAEAAEGAEECTNHMMCIV